MAGAWASAVKSCAGILISRSDDRSYGTAELANGLRVLLVSEPRAEFAAASLSVRVGSFQDPAALPGLAHFCEHMLFLGTARFPDENEYSSFLNQHGGGSACCARARARARSQAPRRRRAGARPRRSPAAATAAVSLPRRQRVHGL